MKYKLAALKCMLLGLMAITVQTNLNAQIQIGQDIDGDHEFERSPSSLSMPDPNTLAIGSQDYDGNDQNRGRVRVFERDGNSWVQKGEDIIGEAPNDFFGSSVSMPDANTVGIGAVYNDAAGSNAGHVRVFTWNGNNWIQKGEDIDGETASNYFGEAVSMPDPNTIAIAAPINDGATVSNGGHVRIFDWDGESWVQRGEDIDGQEFAEHSGRSISMPSVNVVAIGAPLNQEIEFHAGKVRVFEWNGTEWTQKGSTLEGENEEDYFGNDISMPDENTIAIGAYGYDDGQLNSYNYGLARVFSWDGGTWIQKGDDILGEEINDRAGASVFMPNENILAVAAPRHSTNFANEGQVRIFSWTGTEWVVIGEVTGESDADLSGFKIAMGDENTIAIGSQQNADGGQEAGHVRVYDLSALGIVDNSFETDFTVYPNPAFEIIKLNLGAVYQNISLSICDMLGKEVLVAQLSPVSEQEINIAHLQPGLYFLKLTDTGSRKAIIKILKK
jgi:hypothetical protein